MSGIVTEPQPRGTDRAGLLQAMVVEHESGLLRYATRLLNNRAAAEDVVQDTFIKLMRLWEDGLRPSEHLKAWLYRVTHNEAVDHIRRESRLHLLHTRQAEEPTEACPDGVHCGDDERRQLVLSHMRQLDPREQQVLLLRLEEGLSYKDIGRITGRTEGNVGNILHHAVKKVSQSMRKAGVVRP
jgi:RNA polymerase sigma factor (sigma-70 family)